MTTKKQYRNLAQNRNLSEEEFELAWQRFTEKKELESKIDESRIEEIMNQFEQEYDLTGMNINDKISLEQIAKITAMLDLVGDLLNQALLEGETTRSQKFTSINKDLTATLSSLQDDLGITRKSRQAAAGESLDDYLPEIQKKARSFLKERLAYIYCPKCNMLVANAWFANWDNHNELHLVCPRESCQHQFTVTSKELSKKRNKNVEGVLEV